MRIPGSSAAARIIVLSGALLMATAADSTAAGAPLVGDWGGRQIRLSLAETGGKVDFNCASASIDSAVMPDAKGSFTATGRYEAFDAGPMHNADAAPKTIAAHFTGHVDGNTLHLSVHRKGSEAESYTLERDRRVKLIRCM